MSVGPDAFWYRSLTLKNFFADHFLVTVADRPRGKLVAPPQVSTGAKPAVSKISTEVLPDGSDASFGLTGKKIPNWLGEPESSALVVGTQVRVSLAPRTVYRLYTCVQVSYHLGWCPTPV